MRREAIGERCSKKFKNNNIFVYLNINLTIFPEIVTLILKASSIECGLLLNQFFDGILLVGKQCSLSSENYIICRKTVATSAFGHIIIYPFFNQFCLQVKQVFICVTDFKSVDVNLRFISFSNVCAISGTAIFCVSARVISVCAEHVKLCSYLCVQS